MRLILLLFIFQSNLHLTEELCFFRVFTLAILYCIIYNVICKI